jgi:vacuolar protein sorting-associated protein 54
MLRDAEHFKSKIGGLDGAGDTGDYIVSLVKGKSVPKPKPPMTLPTPAKVTGMENTITNGKSSIEIPSRSQGAVTEKGEQEEKQLEKVAEQKAA